MKRKSSCESVENHREKLTKMTRSTEKDKKYDRQLRWVGQILSFADLSITDSMTNL